MHFKFVTVARCQHKCLIWTLSFDFVKSKSVFVFMFWVIGCKDEKVFVISV